MSEPFDESANRPAWQPIASLPCYSRVVELRDERGYEFESSLDELPDHSSFAAVWWRPLRPSKG